MSDLNAKPSYDVAEFHRMAEAGDIPEGARLEWLDGKVILMTPISSRRAACADSLAERMILSSQEEWRVRCRNPLKLSGFAEVSPDVLLLKRRDDLYRIRHPEPADVLLLIEVSDGSLECDRRTRLPLYARAGVPEAWIVDLAHDRIEIHAEPEDGNYRVVSSYGKKMTAISTLLPRVRVRLSDLTGSEDA